MTARLDIATARWRDGTMIPVEIEAPSPAQVHRAAIEKVAQRLATGEKPRRALAGLPLGGLDETGRGEMMLAAVLRARELIAHNHRRNRILGIVWCTCGLIPLLFFTLNWFRHGHWSLVLLVIGAPALINGFRLLRLKPTEQPELD